MLERRWRGVAPKVVFACLVSACNAGSGGSGSGDDAGSGGNQASSASGGSAGSPSVSGGSANDDSSSGGTSSGTGGSGGGTSSRSCGFVETTRLVCDGDTSVRRSYNYDLCFPDAGDCSIPEGGESENSSCFTNWNYTRIFFQGTCADWDAYWDGEEGYDCLIDDHCVNDGRCEAFQCICDGEPCPDPTPVNPATGSGGTAGSGGSSTAGSGGEPTTPSGSGGSSTTGSGGEPTTPSGSGGSSTTGSGGSGPVPPGG